MIDQNILQFSLSLDDIQISDQTQKNEFSQGLTDIQKQSLRRGYVDALAIENMIYVIEEILEKIHIDHKTQHYAQTSDVFMKELSAIFFNSDMCIDQIKLEHAFNEFIEHTEYYVNKVGDEKIHLFIYFIFIREMMHHLNIIEIDILP